MGEHQGNLAYIQPNDKYSHDIPLCNICDYIKMGQIISFPLLLQADEQRILIT